MRLNVLYQGQGKGAKGNCCTWGLEDYWFKAMMGEGLRCLILHLLYFLMQCHQFQELLSLLISKFWEYLAYSRLTEIAYNFSHRFMSSNTNRISVVPSCSYKQNFQSLLELLRFFNMFSLSESQEFWYGLD
jgi:hypothetical protein